MLLACSLGGCGSDTRRYAITFDVVGPEMAFVGRSIRVQGRPSVPRSDPPNNTIAEVGLCTSSREKLLNTQIQVVVSDDAGILSDTLVERVACKFGDTNGNWEIDQVFLADDGSIVSAFGSDPRVNARCIELETDCSSEDL